MTVFINPGSNIGDESKKGNWTNTHETALKRANKWFDNMKEDGFVDIEMIDTGRKEDGRWVFVFRHKVTGVEVELEHHGIDDIEEYERDYIFTPRIYWSGSSTAEPELEDFVKEGFEIVKTIRRTSHERTNS